MMKTLKDFPYQNVLVLGMARSGKAAATLLLKSGKNVRINDKSIEESSDIYQLKSLGAELVLGSHPISVLENIDIVVKNPGISYDHFIIQHAKEREIPIITEIELVQFVYSGMIIGITGSNGKTTTTTLISEMLSCSQQKNAVAGNIGVAASEIAQSIEESTKLILELSSFQLLGIETFKPNIAVLLNIYEAHLDYHQTIEHYEQAKYKLFKNQTYHDYLIYNYDDEKIKQAVKNSNAKQIPFSTTTKLATGAWMDDEYLYYGKEKIIKKREIALVGEHHFENMLAAICVAKICHVTTEAIQKTLTTFQGVKHRLQFVKKINGRFFYNDSKATNMLATEKALHAFSQPIILLAGGLDRGDQLSELSPHLVNVKQMVVFGETADQFVNVAKQNNIPVKKVKDVSTATKVAYVQSEPGDVILLSPACASWDQYKTFEERGDMFINSVHKLN